VKRKITVIGIIITFLLTAFASLSAVGNETQIKSSGKELPDFEIIELSNVHIKHLLWIRVIAFDLKIKNNGADFEGKLSWNCFIDGIDPDWYTAPSSQGRYILDVTILEGETITISTDQEWPYDRKEHELAVVVDYEFFTELEGYITGEEHGEIEELDETNNYYLINHQYKIKSSPNHRIPRFLDLFPNAFPLLRKLLGL
jgi:hypothetical protein